MAWSWRPARVVYHQGRAGRLRIDPHSKAYRGAAVGTVWRRTRIFGSASAGGTLMRILLIASSYNSMTQRVHAELADGGHQVSVELALGDELLRDGVRLFDPDLVIAPMLTTAIPADISSARTCLIVHPGPAGDWGPSALD